MSETWAIISTSKRLQSHLGLFIRYPPSRLNSVLKVIVTKQSFQEVGMDYREELLWFGQNFLTSHEITMACHGKTSSMWTPAVIERKCRNLESSKRACRTNLQAFLFCFIFIDSLSFTWTVEAYSSSPVDWTGAWIGTLLLVFSWLF